MGYHKPSSSGVRPGELSTNVAGDLAIPNLPPSHSGIIVGFRSRNLIRECLCLTTSRASGNAGFLCAKKLSMYTLPKSGRLEKNEAHLPVIAEHSDAVSFMLFVSMNTLHRRLFA